MQLIYLQISVSGAKISCDYGCKVGLLEPKIGNYAKGGTALQLYVIKLKGGTALQLYYIKLIRD